MLNAINNMLNENNLTMTCCNASFHRRDEKLTLNAICQFSGAVAKFLPILYKVLNDCGMETEEVSITENVQHTDIRFIAVVKELPVMAKHFAELDSNWNEMEIKLGVKDGQLNICNMKSGYFFSNTISASATSVQLYDAKKKQTSEIYTYDGWDGFMATEFKDIMGELETARKKEEAEARKQFCIENTYCFTVKCPTGVYHYITRPRIWAKKGENMSAERFAKSYVGWKNGVERNKKGLITFYNFILDDFITSGKSMCRVAVKNAEKFYKDGYGTKLMPEHYENFVIIRMEKMENLDCVVKESIRKVRKVN